MGLLYVWQVSAISLVNPANVGSKRPLSDMSEQKNSIVNVPPHSGDPPPTKGVKVRVVRMCIY